MMDVNSGYIGYSMSRRAAEAYEDGEMPKSKWTKKGHGRGHPILLR